LKAGSSMEFAIGLRKWAVLKVGLLSPAGESMKSSLTSIIFMGSFIMDILQKGFRKRWAILFFVSENDCLAQV
jgi:hypothetical protein